MTHTLWVIPLREYYYVITIMLYVKDLYEHKVKFFEHLKIFARQKIKNFKFLNHYGKRGLRSWFWFEIWHEIGRPQFQLNFIIKKRFWHLVFLPPSPNKRLKIKNRTVLIYLNMDIALHFDWQYDTGYNT